MKNTIKILSTGLLISQIILSSCKGPAGGVGPAGAEGKQGIVGAQGIAGIQGTKGETGNANVVQYTFSTPRLAGGEMTYSLNGLTQNQLINSSVFVYVLSNLNTGAWYALPGYTSGGNNHYRVYVSNTLPNVYIFRNSGTSTETFNTTRILIIPANDLRNGRKPAIDFSDYKAVKAYYNLKD